MSRNQLVQYCHSQYALKEGQCPDCPNKEQGLCVSKNCSTCFHDMFFRGKERSFNCICSTYSYVCRYIYQYSSEIIYLLRLIKSIFTGEHKLENLNIMSIGCGPCSEAFAIELFCDEIKYEGNISYCGFDLNPIWEEVHSFVTDNLSFPASIITEDCFQYIESKQDFSYPNILIFNYLFSDIAVRGNLNQFITDVVEKIIDKMPAKSIIIVNDINHYMSRDYYKVLIRKSNIKNNITQASLSFSGYQYGDRYSYNNAFFYLKEDSLKKLISLYDTRTLCKSAQLLMLKRSNKE